MQTPAPLESSPSQGLPPADSFTSLFLVLVASWIRYGEVTDLPALPSKHCDDAVTLGIRPTKRRCSHKSDLGSISKTMPLISRPTCMWTPMPISLLRSSRRMSDCTQRRFCTSRAFAEERGGARWNLEFSNSRNSERLSINGNNPEVASVGCSGRFVLCSA